MVLSIHRVYLLVIVLSSMGVLAVHQSQMGDISSLGRGRAHRLSTALSSSTQTVIRLHEDYMDNPGQSYPLTNYRNSQYTLAVDILPNGDIFNGRTSMQILLDTGSGGTWINTDRCEQPVCKAHPALKSSPQGIKGGRLQGALDKAAESSEARGEIRVSYGKGRIKGIITKIDVLSSRGGLALAKGVNVIGLVRPFGGVFSRSGFDGVAGLKLQSIDEHGLSNVPEKIFDRMGGAARQIAFEFGREYGKGESRGQSRVYFGTRGRLDLLYTMERHNAIRSSGWIIKIDDIQVGGKSLGLCKFGCEGMVDTGSSIVTAPREQLGEVLEALKIESDCSNYSRVPDLE